MSEQQEQEHHRNENKKKMASPSTCDEEKNLFYSRLLDDLKNLEKKIEESDENESNENELNEFRRSVCGCSINKTDDAKIESENASSSTSDPANQHLLADDESDKSNEYTKKFYQDLNDESISIHLVEKISKLIAELAKDEECRQCLTDQNLFPALNKYLSDSNATDLTKTQIVRAIGNLCYYNDKGRLKFLNLCGLNSLIDLCKYCTNLNYTNTSDEEKKTMNTLLTVTLGCFHNITNENETLRKAAYDFKIISILKGFVKYLKNSIGILIHFGSFIQNLLELDEGKKQFVEEKFALELYNFIDEELLLSLNDHVEDFFYVLTFINELDLSKYYLCQTEFLVKAVKTIETHLNNPELVRQLSLFLVNLVVKDDKVDDIYEYKNSFLLNKSIDWLIDFKNEQFYIASAVIIANYMRNDDNVKKIMQDPRHPHIRLLGLLKEYKQSNKKTLQDINVIHSLLGALRNFCVAVGNRNEILKSNLIEIVLPFVEYENPEVKAKSLSIIRLVVKNINEETGLNLIFNNRTLETFEQIATNPSDHVQIVGESSRLSCYLPIAAKSELNIKKLLNYNFIEIISQQLGSQHPIMINEALLALNIVVAIDYNDFFTRDDLTKYLECLQELKLLADTDYFKNQVNILINKIETELI